MTEHKFVENVEYKQCSCCKEFKTLNKFQKRKDSKDGYRDKCIACLDIVKQAWLNQPVENVTHKICTKCKIDKPVSEYTKDNNSVDGYSYNCKDCIKRYRQQNIEQINKYNSSYNNKPEIKEYRKNYYQQYKLSHPEKIKKNSENSLNYYYKNKERILAKQREQYKLKNLKYIQEAEQRKQQKEKRKQEQLKKKQEQLNLLAQGLKRCNTCNTIKQLSEFYKRKSCSDGYSGQCKFCEIRKQQIYMNNLTPEQKEKRKQYHKEYAIQNKEKILMYQKLYKENNKDKIKESEKVRYSKIKINKDASVLINKSLKGEKLSWYTEFNYNLKQLKEHLESQFTPEMSWDNYGTYWEIDHIIPQRLFKIKSRNNRQFKICWSLLNLRPLEKIINRQRPKDGSDIPEELKQKILNQKEI